MIDYTKQYFEETVFPEALTKTRSFRSFCVTCKAHYADLIIEKTSFLDSYEPLMLERLYCVYNSITEPPLCPYCGNKRKFDDRKTSYYTTCCSKACVFKDLSDIRTGQTSISVNRDTAFVEEQRKVTQVNDEVIKSLVVYDKFVPFIDNPVILSYLESRYADSSSLLETVQRIRFGVEHKPVCPTCGKPVTWLGKKSHMYTKYCSNLKCAANNEETKQLKRQALIDNWGGAGCYNTDKYRAMMREKYGVETHMQREGIAEKRNKTLMERYGTTTIYDIPGVREKVKETCINRYGTDCILTVPEIRMKSYTTSMENAKMQKSESEDRLYNTLVGLGYNVERWKVTEKFCYNVDFYLPDYDLYIEYQGSQFHNGRAYLGTKEDVDELNFLMQKDKEKGGGSQYEKIAYVWSDLDVRKRTEAKKLGIRFLEIYSFKNAEDVERQIDMFLRFLGIRNLVVENKAAILSEYEYYRSLKDEELHAATSNKNLAVKYFQQDIFYAKERHSFVYDPIARRRVIQNRMTYLNKKEYELTTGDILRGYKVSGEVYGYSHFNPRWVNYIINKFCVHSVYDACGGWGHHALGMLSCDKIIYNDVSTEVCNNVNRMRVYLCIQNMLVHNGDAGTYIPEDVDMFFACPPYYNVEDYGGVGFDSISAYGIFLNDIFGVWHKNKANIFCLVIREDLVELIYDEYSEVYDLDVQSSHLVKDKKYREKIYIFKKSD